LHANHGTSKLRDPLLVSISLPFSRYQTAPILLLVTLPSFPLPPQYFFLTKHLLTMAKLKYFQKIVLDEKGIDLIQPQITAQGQHWSYTQLT